MSRIFSKASKLAFSSFLVALASGASALADDIFYEQGGLVIVEIESEPTVDDWLAQSSFPNFTGTSYYKWNGQDYFNSPGNSVLRYQVHINTPGIYNLWIRNRHEHPDSTEENDCWTKMDGDPWIKTYSNGPGTVSQWNWVSQFELNGGSLHQQARYNLSAGVHTFRIAARSHGFYIDRFHLAVPGHPDQNKHQLPQSECVVSSEHCSSNPNSSGNTAELVAIGSDEISDADFRLIADNLPTGQLGYFIGSPTNGFSAMPGNSDGNLCMSGNIVRFNGTILNSGTDGTFRRTLNLAAFPGPNGGPVFAGETWYFQAWFRDDNPNPTSNFTNGAEVTFQ